MNFSALKKFLQCLFCFFVFSFYISACADVWDSPEPLENIASKLPEITDIKCRFAQEKTIPNIDKTFVSSGDFQFIKNEGVYFYVKQPIVQEINYTNRNYKQINEVIKAVSSKKFKKLEKEFDFFFEKNTAERSWTLGLKPKEKTAEFLSSITLEGSDFIQRIKIEMINGALTDIRFEK